jgi:hypothetical protein
MNSKSSPKLAVAVATLCSKPVGPLTRSLMNDLSVAGVL